MEGNFTCSYEWEDLVYLRLFGQGVEDPADISVELKQDFVVTARDNILVVRADREDGVTYRFDLGALVLAPQIGGCRRNTNCSQSVKYHEVSAFIDVSRNDTRQLQPCDVIFALDGEVYFDHGNQCNCNAADAQALISDSRAGVNDALPHGRRFVIHLSRSKVKV